MNVLITGGAGFIGSHTARALHDLGCQVRILDCLDPQIHGSNAFFSESLRQIAECIRGDVCNESDCQQALDGVECVLHLASRTGVGQSMYDIGDYVRTNVLGTAVLVESILKSRVKLKRFVLSSSRAVYGEGLFHCGTHGVLHPSLRNPKDMQAGDFLVRCPKCREPMTAVPTHSSCPTDPLSVYAVSKKQQEDYCGFAARTFELPLITLRYFNVYGSLQSLNNPYTGVVSIFFSLLRDGQALSMYERGLPIRDFVHVSDVVQANLLALEKGPVGMEAYNVGTGVPSSIADIAHAQAKAMGLKAHLVDRGEYRIGDIFGCYADISRSQEVLGYQPRVDLENGMEEFISWASGQESENKYDQTVEELRDHGLFGRAEC